MFGTVKPSGQSLNIPLLPKFSIQTSGTHQQSTCLSLYPYDLSSVTIRTSRPQGYAIYSKYLSCLHIVYSVTFNVNHYLVCTSSHQNSVPKFHHSSISKVLNSDLRDSQAVQMFVFRFCIVQTVLTNNLNPNPRDLPFILHFLLMFLSCVRCNPQ